MILAGDFRNGVTFEYDNNIFQVIEFQHVKPGKGAAFVRTKMKNIVSGATVERTFNPNDKMPKAIIERKDMQYLYSDDDLYYFMDVQSFEQIPISKETIGNTLALVKENEVVRILSHNGKVFGIEPPTFVELEVIETDPGFKGDTTNGATKPATVETGFVIKVPLFVNTGDIIRIDTRSNDYMERVKG